MNDQDKLNYLDNHFREIWTSKTNNLVGFVSECLDDSRLQELLETWPLEIKLRVVERHLKEKAFAK